MRNIDITILCVMTAFSLYLSFISLFKRIRLSGNVLFFIFNLSVTATCLILLFPVLNIDYNFSYSHKIYFCLLIFSFQILVSILHVFPGWEKKTPRYLILLSQLPGLSAIILTLLTDKIILNIGYNSGLIYALGKQFYFYAAVFLFYLTIFLILAVWKYRNLKNKSFKRILNHQVLSILSGVICFAALSIILPLYNNYSYTISGVALLFLIPAFIMNYTLSGENFFDIKNYYIKAGISIIFIAGLTIPAYFFFKIAVFFNLDSNRLSLIAGAVILSVYFFLFFNFLKPVAESMLNKKNKKLSAVFTGITNNIYRFSNIKKQLNWNTFFKDGIDYLCSELSIKSAHLFLQTSGPDFELVHEYGEGSKLQQIPGKQNIIAVINKYKQIIEKSIIYTDPELRKSGDELLNFFLEHDAEIIIPVFLEKNELVALLILGEFNERKSFPLRDYIYFLDSYRLHLETLLGKILFSEDVRKTQISKRDIMVIRNIKKRIIPARFNNINGLKISSIYVDNSEFGGDYFNTVKMNENKAGIFLSNVSDMGIESIILALQINSVFRSQAQSYESPEIMMNNINQVLCSSRFTDKYATSIYIIYDSSTREIAFSNAAFNSLLVYDPKKESFDEYDAEGIPLGIDMGFRYKHRTVFAPVNSVGLLYSSGLTSAFNRQGNSYSPSRLKDIIMINKDDEPAEIVKKIYNDFKSFIDDNTLLNDISIILFRMI